MKDFYAALPPLIAFATAMGTAWFNHRKMLEEHRHELEKMKLEIASKED